MLENWDEIVEWLRTKSFTDDDIQHLQQLLTRSLYQEVSQSGKFNINLGEGSGIQIADGATPEQIRLIIRELVHEIKTLQFAAAASIESSIEHSTDISEDLDFEEFILDIAVIEAINVRLKIIQEIYSTGCIAEAHQKDLIQLSQHLQPYIGLKKILKKIEREGDRLIQDTIADLRQHLENLQVSGASLTDKLQLSSLPTELECHQAEAEVLQKFSGDLENSRLGAAWVTQNLETLTRYASKRVLKQFHLEISDQKIDDFRFSLKQFLEQVSFCLYWGAYGILDSPDIPFELEIEHYEAAFQAVKKSVSPELSDETVHAIEVCLDYLISRLPLIETN